METEPVHGGDGFIAHYQGYALLKMPRPDSLSLVTPLAATPNFGRRVTRRWQPGSWRMGHRRLAARRQKAWRYTRT